MEVGELAECLNKALTWRLQLAEGNFIEHISEDKAEQWCDDHLSFRHKISSVELDFIMEIVNKFFEFTGSTLRVGWSMGEIIPSNTRKPL